MCACVCVCACVRVCECACVCVCLQRNSLSAADGLYLAIMTIRTLKSRRADDIFGLFCKDVTTPAEHNFVNAPSNAATAAAFIDKMETLLLNSMKHRSRDIPPRFGVL